MAKSISIIDSFIISFVSMAAIFAVLVIIYYLVDFLKIAGDKENKDEKESEELVTENEPDDEELIAVITAAVAVNLGVSPPRVNIKSIKRIPSTASIWAQVGRREQTMDRL